MIIPMFTGEIVKITKSGVKSICVVPRPNDVASAFCIFEYVYFARHDSILEGNLVQIDYLSYQLI